MHGWVFKVSNSNPCMYQHESGKIRCLVHRDDFVSVGSPENQKWMKAKLSARFEIKTTTVGPSAEGEVMEARTLNRVIRVIDQGSEYEADQRHADLIIQETVPASKGTLSHPGGGKKALEEEAESKELMGTEASRFRAVAARANYLSADRPDIQYSVKDVCRRMAKPVGKS